MISNERVEVPRLLSNLCELTPDVRFGQLIANLSYLAIGPTAEAIWEMEDDQLIKAIKQLTANLSDRSGAPPAAVPA